MITNQEREKTALQIADILNNCNMLMVLEIENRVDKYILSVVADEVNIEYTEHSLDGMNWFLSKLKMYTNNKEDIDSLLEEIDHL